MPPDSLIPAEYNGRRFHAYNDWIKRTHGGRLQKISVNAGFTCPNRDGSLGVGGCSFCNNEGFSPSYLRDKPDLFDQIDTGVDFVRRRYSEVKQFIAYFQSYSNTYGDISAVSRIYEQVLSHPDIHGLAIGSRPDCLSDDMLDYLAELSKRTFIELEIGIESCNDQVLAECLRGHDFSCTEDAIYRAAQRNLFITGPLLIGLPKETRESMIEGARVLSHMPLDALKFHQLQIVRNTRLANQYQNAPESIRLLSPDEYVDMVIDMLEYLPAKMKIQRLGSEVPPSQRLSPDWGMRLERYPHLFEARLKARNTWQGRLFDASC